MKDTGGTSVAIVFAIWIIIFFLGISIEVLAGDLWTSIDNLVAPILDFLKELV